MASASTEHLSLIAAALAGLALLCLLTWSLFSARREAPVVRFDAPIVESTD